MLSGVKSGPLFGTSRSAEDHPSKPEESRNFLARSRYTTEKGEKNKMEDEDSLKTNSNSRKRPHDSDTDEKHDRDSAMKRSNNSEDANSEEKANIKIMIPSAVMGSVIGKGGETIGNLQKDSGCRVKVSKNTDFFPHTNERVALVSGTITSMMKVIGFLCDKYKDKADLPSKNDPFDHKMVDRSKQIKLIVPSTSAGMIIGKGGEHIKSIKEVTQFPVQLSPKDALDPRLGERVITVAGRQLDDALAGVRMILNKVALDSSNSLAPYTSVTYVNFTNLSTTAGHGTQSSMNQQDSRAPLMHMVGRPRSPVRPSFAPPAYSSSMMGTPPGAHGSTAPPLSSYYQSRSSAHTPPPLSTYQLPYRAASPTRANGAAAGGAAQVGPFDTLHNQSQGGPNVNQWLQQQQQSMANQQRSATSMAPQTTPIGQSGMGNLQVLQFLDGMRSTLRSNNYNELSISEITQAMHTLAKYNVLGLGLGFGLSAISKAPTVESDYSNTTQLSANQAAQTAPMSSMPPPAAIFGTSNPQPPSLMSNIGFAGFDASKVGTAADPYFNPSFSDRSPAMFSSSNAPNDHHRSRDDSASSLGYVSRSTLRAEHHSPVRGRSPGLPPRPPNFNAQPLFNESRRDDAKIELTVPESAIGAILGKQGRNLADIQRYSGARIDVSKRDAHFSAGGAAAPDRFIVLQGAPEAVHAARRKIEACVDEARRGKRRQGDERF